MIWLFLSITCSVLIFVVFKLLKHFEIDNLQAILINYFIAYGIGQMQAGNEKGPLQLFDQPWIWSVLILGLLFITLFRLMAWVSQNYGMATVSVAVKMAVIVPVSFGILYFQESSGPLKLVGIILALVAVYMTTYQPQKMKRSAAAFWFPIVLFIGSGFLDAFLKYNEAELVPKVDQAWFASSIFGFAAVFGIILVLYQLLVEKKSFAFKSVLGGIALGIPNYGSIYFLLQALSMQGLESSSIFALNNVGVVFFSALLGYFFYKEKLSRINLTGIVLAMVSIVLIALVL